MIEARDRVGGRLSTVDVDGEPFELGGQWIGPTSRRSGRCSTSWGSSCSAGIARATRPAHAVGRPPRARGDRAGRRRLRRLRGRGRQLRRPSRPSTPRRRGRTRRAGARRRSYEQWLQAEVPHDGRTQRARVRRIRLHDEAGRTFSMLQTAWLLSSAGEVEHLLDAGRGTRRARRRRRAGRSRSGSPTGSATASGSRSRCATSRGTRRTVRLAGAGEISAARRSSRSRRT